MTAKAGRGRKIVWGALLTCAIGLAGAEIGGRYLGFGYPLLFQASPAGYEVSPNQQVKHMGKHISINAFGMRGKATTAAPQPGTVRVLSLGDSVSFGTTQNDDAQTYPALTEKALAGQHIEILNASAGGWALENERRWLATHGAFGAKVVVLEVNQRDLTQGMAPGGILDTNPAFPTHNPASALVEIATRYIAPKLHLTAAAVDPGSTGNGAVVPEAETFAPLLAIHQMVKLSGAKMMILYWDMRDPRTAAPDRREKLLAWAKANDVPVVRPNLIARPDVARLFIDGAHPNAAGNALIAQQLAPALREQLH